MSANPRVPTYPIAEQFIERWSPRAFTGESIAESTLLGFIEAARWAPSAYNSQPWRFLYALRDGADWPRYLELLNEFNRGWAQHASALLVIASKTTFAAPGKTEEQPAPTHDFDTGAAWGFFALQAHLASHGVQTLIHYPIPPHQQKAYSDWNTRSYPLTEAIHQQVLSLPMGPTMTVEDAHTVIAACNQWAG